MGPQSGAVGRRGPAGMGETAAEKGRWPSISPWRGNYRRPAPRHRSAGDVREPSLSVRPAVEAGAPHTRGSRPGEGEPRSSARVPGVGGARILSGPGGRTIFAQTPEAPRVLDPLPGPKVWGALTLAHAPALTGRGGRSTTSGACCGRCRRLGHRSRSVQWLPLWHRLRAHRLQ